MYLRTSLLLTLFTVSSAFMSGAAEYVVSSPDGNIAVTVSCSERITYSVTSGGEVLMEGNPVSLELCDGTVWGSNPRVKNYRRKAIRETIPAPFYRKSHVVDNYNSIVIDFREGFALEFRAYDDGMAYRFISRSRTSLKIKSEQAGFVFAEDALCWVPYVRDRPLPKKDLPFDDQFMQSFENTYTHTPVKGWDPERLGFTPVLVESPSGVKMCITDADLEGYPGMFLSNTDGGSTLRAVHAPYPIETYDGGYDMMQSMVGAYGDYIAEVPAGKEFPWRTVAIATEDKDLADNDLVYRLASSCRIDDTSWIKPGKVAWEWWNACGLYGVDFEAGVNQQTYQHYIDFASKWNIEYIILDDGWTGPDKYSVFDPIPELDLPALVKYGEERGVGLILWMGYLPFAKNMEEVCRVYSEMGIKGFKVDFMDRDDQPTVEFTYKGAETAARYNLLLDYHGIYKPTGLQRTWPNVINYEGVHGLEQVKWSPVEVDQVTYDVTMPFIRMFAGPVDYTQGAMRNSVRYHFNPVYEEPSSQGTRCRQLAQYVVFDSPLNMLCDSPTNYDREPECTRFIASVPTVWDETRMLGGKVGKYIVTSRRSGDVWYVGGMAGWDGMQYELDLSFLPEGNYYMELFTDGPNARKLGRDFTLSRMDVTCGGKLPLTLMPGGGFAAVMTPR